MQAGETVGSAVFLVAEGRLHPQRAQNGRPTLWKAHLPFPFQLLLVARPESRPDGGFGCDHGTPRTAPDARLARRRLDPQSQKAAPAAEITPGRIVQGVPLEDASREVAPRRRSVRRSAGTSAMRSLISVSRAVGRRAGMAEYSSGFSARNLEETDKGFTAEAQRTQRTARNPEKPTERLRQGRRRRSEEGCCQSRAPARIIAFLPRHCAQP